MITIPHYISRKFIQQHNGIYNFVFATTANADIRAGQGEVCVGQPNCFGVPTKFRNCKSDPSAFFRDNQFDVLIKPLIDKAIEHIPRDLPIIVFPKIGCGCARLNINANYTLEYLRNELGKIGTPYKVDYTMQLTY